MKTPAHYPTTTVDPKKVRLDPENPRFPVLAENAAQAEEALIRHLLKGAELQELIESIGANGYLSFEPIIVLGDETTKDEDLVVVEGNRRVAALKLFRNAALARKLKVKLPEVAPGIEKTFESIAAIRIEKRKQARQFIGFKHINGPHKWDSYAKARFATDWLDSEGKGASLADISLRLGDRHDTILRLVNGIRVLDQAIASKVFSLDSRDQSRPFAFSHLYTALTRPTVRTYLGMDEQWRDAQPKANPVPKAKKAALQQLMTWLYGNEDDGVRPVVTSQNPHVKQLAEVLGDSTATRKLESGQEFSKVYASVNSRWRRFQDKLVAASAEAEEAQSLVDAYEKHEDSLFRMAEDLAKIANNILATMRRFK